MLAVRRQRDGRLGGRLPRRCYYLGRKGGEALVRKRFSGDERRARDGALQRYGVMAVLVPCLLPPPAPFKIFVLLAGVAGISARAVADAPSPSAAACRYLALGHARGRVRRAGDDATCASTAPAASLVAVGVLAVGFGAYLLWTKAPGGQRPIRSRMTDRSPDDPELSVVIPIRNEAPSLVELHRELTETLTAWGRPVRDHRRRRRQHGRELCRSWRGCRRAIRACA